MVEPAPGLTGGALLTGPVAFTVGPGEMELVDWQVAGLPNHSGGVRYRRRLEATPGDAVLDLGEVRGTAEVFVDGESAGVRVCSPYRFDLGGRIGAAGAALEVLVLNTLGPHLDAVSPTPYVFDGPAALRPVRSRPDAHLRARRGPGPLTSTVVPSGAGSCSPMSRRNGGYLSVIRVA